MNNEPSVITRILRALFYGAAGVFIINFVIADLIKAIKTKSIESLSMAGGYGPSYVVYGYEALLVHIAILVFGLFFIIMSLEQVKLIKEQW